MKIVVSGDSFTFGQGCSDKPTVYDPKSKTWRPDHDYDTTSNYCWASLLQQHYPGSEVVNLAQPGRDNIYISTSIMDNLHDADLVIFPATAFNRMQAANPFDPKRKDTWVIGNPIFNAPQEYQDAAKQYIMHLYSEEYLAEITTMAILAVYADCRTRGIPFIWSCCPFGTLSIDEASGIYQHFKRRTMIIENHEIPPLFGYYQHTYFGHDNVPSVEDNPFLHNDGHANDVGHKYYFETEILPAVKKYLG